MVSAGAGQRDEFEKWLDGRPKWLQTAASRLIGKHKKPAPEEISVLADLCIAEASEVAGAIFEQVPTGALGSTAAGLTLKLLRQPARDGF